MSRLFLEFDIKNTFGLTKILVSEGCLSEISREENSEIGTTMLQLNFDDSGKLISLVR